MNDPQAGITVAISRQKGSGGAYVGRSVAQRLGLRYIDRELLRDAAEYQHVNDRDRTAAADAESSWWTRLGRACALGGPEGIYVPPSEMVAYEGDVFEVENRLIQEIVRDHVAVIVGRGAAQILRGRPSVVTAFVHAPEPWRVERLQQVYGIADRSAALRAIQASDHDRARFIRRLSGVEWTDVRQYDVAVDTAAIGLDAAIDIIVRAAAGRLARARGVPAGSVTGV